MTEPFKDRILAESYDLMGNNFEDELVTLDVTGLRWVSALLANDTQGEISIKLYSSTEGRDRGFALNKSVTLAPGSRRRMKVQISPLIVYQWLKITASAHAEGPHPDGLVLDVAGGS